LKYDRDVRKPKRRSNAEKRTPPKRAANIRTNPERMAKSAAREEIDLITNITRRNNVDAGFDDCVKARVNPKEQHKLYGNFFMWEKVYPMPNGIASVPALSDSGDDVDFSRLLFRLKINQRYGLSAKKSWLPWVCIKRSDMAAGDQRPYGLFADRYFRKGDVVGVYMGEPVEAGQQKSRSLYCMAGVADAKGGMNSGRPALLGMHFINDPAFQSGKRKATIPKRKLVPNVVCNTDGVLTASHNIDPGREILLDYNSVGKV
jgi:hypothetical protein